MSATTIGIGLIAVVVAFTLFEVFVDMGRATKETLGTMRVLRPGDWVYYGLWAAGLIGVALILWELSVYSD